MVKYKKVGENMELEKKLNILTDSAKYDVACTSSGVQRDGVKGKLGNAAAWGICHSFSADGRCISLLKLLLTNICIYDCKYCINRKSNDLERAIFTPREIADLTINFYKRNYIEGLFLSSAIVKNPNYTMELLYETLRIVREEYGFNGYIHVKAIPGADDEIIKRTGLLADRMSVNIEMPSEKSLNTYAPDKTRDSILKPMKKLRDNIINSKEELVLYKNAPKFVPAGQSTQMIIGASPESDGNIIRLSQGLYKNYSLKRVFYSAYIPVNPKSKLLPVKEAPLHREHRLYQADWLLRFYKFDANEIVNKDENLNLFMDPKCQWAINNLDHFPMEINTAPYNMLIRIPGIGTTSAKKIVAARKDCTLDFNNLVKMRISLKRARYFITCSGKMYERFPFLPEYLQIRLENNDTKSMYSQISLWDKNIGIEDKEKENERPKLSSNI